MKPTHWIPRATLMLALAGPIAAQTGRPAQIHDVPVSWGFVAEGYTPRTIPRFNGQLTAVRVIVCRMAAVQFKSENLNPLMPATHYFGASPLVQEDLANAVGVEVRMNSTNGIKVVDSTSGGESDSDAHIFDVTVSHGPFDGLVDFAGNSGHNTGQMGSGLVVERFTILPGDPLFSNFQGLGNVTLQVRRMGLFHITSETAPFLTEVTGWSGARIHFHYFGTPNPPQP
jgi:hypothetical protein